MAIHYRFVIVTEKTSKEIIETFGAAHHEDGSIFLRDEPAIVIAPTSVDHPVTKAYFEEEFGFFPTAGVSFTFDKFHQDQITLQKKMLRSVVAVLAKEKGDAALEFDAGPPLLRRKQGGLELNENWSSWKTHPPEGLELDYRLVSSWTDVTEAEAPSTNRLPQST